MARTGSGRRAALVAALLQLALWLGLAPAYGPTWDEVRTELPYGEAFLAAVVRGEPDYLALRFDPGLEHRAPHPDLSLGRLPWYAAWPLTSLVGAAACQVLWTGLGLLPPLVAHHLGVGLLVAVLVGVVFRAVDRRFGRAAAVLSAAFLVATPRFFAHSFNNLKDAPEACLYSLAYLAACLAWARRRALPWAGVGALFALALVQRPNALFLGPQLALFGGGAWLLARRRARREGPGAAGGLPGPPWKGLFVAALVAPVVYFACTPALWVDPLGRLVEQAHFTFARSTDVEVGAGPVGLGRISWHGLGTFLLGTPLSVLALAAVGLLDRRRPPEVRLFLALGVLVPVGRTLLPGMRDYDGLRHFLEFHPPLSVLAGLGAARVAELAARPFARPGRARAAAAALCLAPCLTATFVLHPNSLCFYNRLAGGLAGARRAGIEDATDYWGNSYWQGLAWLEEHAEPEARLIVPVAEHVARCAAPLRLGRELFLDAEGSGPAPPVLYVMAITRRTGDALEVLDRVEGLEAVHEVRVQGAPILRIHRLVGEDARAVCALWRDQRAARASGLKILKWLKEDRALLLEIRKLKRERGVQAAVEELSRHLPEELLGEAEQFVRLQFGEELGREAPGVEDPGPP